ncbi:ArsR family transcriptional regulator [Nonomuraea terrae]|uniref:ArsR family transcriptional regulator n=1 Tax=Nonomuraea terrae TaxID=2530383 RepID=A0A4R4YIS8_9ACTN|nr:metalloregulator ArsR/SmtB family transcription factor [Nonomuraea terrae]TDD43252.1 ArsR family transcriptional regulator [Nonomuraea terrae]
MTMDGIELSSAARGFLKAMASETRQQIMGLFAGGVELTVNEVAERMSLAQSATSTHLATLRDGGVLVSRREWKTVYYRADSARISKALADLQATLNACCPPDDLVTPTARTGCRGGEGR